MILLLSLTPMLVATRPSIVGGMIILRQFHTFFQADARVFFFSVNRPTDTDTDTDIGTDTATATATDTDTDTDRHRHRHRHTDTQANRDTSRPSN